MTDTSPSLRRKISAAEDLRSVVRTMKALAASSIGQYDKSVRGLVDYTRTVELGLSVCLPQSAPATPTRSERSSGAAEVGAIVFGSDQGLVGRFNDVLADHVIATLAPLAGKPRVWAVGERIHGRLADAGLPLAGRFAVPGSVSGIAPLVGQVQVDSEAHRSENDDSPLYVFHNQPRRGALYEPVEQRLLPLDAEWQRSVREVRWPTRNLPEVMGSGVATLRTLVREYLFISLFRACAESLASENASRLSAMERADRSIDESIEKLRGTFHRLRKQSIDEELFDVVAGYDALGGPPIAPDGFTRQNR